MDLLLFMLNAGVALVMAVQVNFYFNAVLGKESGKPAKRWYIAAFILLAWLFLTVPLPPIGSSLLGLAAIYCLSLGYSAEGRLRIAFTMLYAVLLTLVNAICVFLFDPSLTAAEDSAKFTEGSGQLLLLIGCIVMFAVIQVIRFIAKRRRYTLHFRYYLLFLSVPAVSIYLVNVLSTYSEKNIHFYISVAGLIAWNVLVVYVLDTLIVRFSLQHENARLQQQMDYQDANYEKTVAGFKKMKSLIHDTNQHLLYLAACIDRGDTGEAREYIRGMMNRMEEAYYRVNTGNLVIDALVTNALNVGQASGIRMDTELQLFDREVPIERYDLCVVLGNMLDNAIDASKKVKVTEDRHIRIHIRSGETALYIRIRNRVDRAVTDLRSRKANPDDHGYGLANITRICDKYGGHMTIETEGRTFDNMVVLPFASVQESLA